MPRFERLSPDHAVESFHSGNDELDTWLWHAAATADRAGTARTYIWIDGENDIAGYFAILPHNIRRDEVPTPVGRGAPGLIPGFLLGRLALAENLHGSGRGGALLAGALGTILAAMRCGGGRGLLRDPVTSQPVIRS